MLFHSQAIKQNVVLRADSEAFPDQIDIRSDVKTINDGSSGGRREQARKNRHGSGLTSAVMTKKRSDLTLVQIEIQPVHS